MTFLVPQLHVPFCIVNDFKQEKKNKTKGPLEMH